MYQIIIARISIKCTLHIIAVTTTIITDITQDRRYNIPRQFYSVCSTRETAHNTVTSTIPSKAFIPSLLNTLNSKIKTK